MQPALFLTEIERALSPADAPVVLTAIKQDQLVWSALQQPGYVRSILSDDCSDISAWTPASVALKPLGDRVRLAELASDHIPAIEGSLRKQALELLEATIKTGAAVDKLTDAGLLALALRERRRKLQSWRGIYDALVSMKNKDNRQLFEVWRTPLACLFTIIPDGKDLLAALLPNNSLHPAMEWISHILLSNPMEPETRVELFREVMSRASLEHQVEWLRYLKRMGQSSLAGSLAEAILAEKGSGLEIGRDEFRPERADWADLSGQVLNHQIAAALHQFAGHPLQAGLHLEKVRGLLQHWLVGSTVQMVSLAERSTEGRDAIVDECARLLKLFPVGESLAAESSFAIDQKSVSFTLSDPEFPSTPLLAKLEQARQLSQSGSRRQAQEIAYVALHAWLKQVEKDPSLLSGQFIYEFNPYGMLNQLVALGLYSDAIAAGERFLTVRPEDRGLMIWTSDLCHRIGDDEKAVNLLYQVALIDPGNAETLRKLAALYEDRKEWEQAVVMRRRVLEIVPLPAIDDHLALARCAHGAANYADVRQTCAKVLAIDPDQGMAYTYLGMACLAENDLDEGLANLNKATLLIPENSLPWIQLADAYKRSGEPQRALETLRAAIITAPDSAELHFALGLACLEAGLNSEALPFLRQSARLAPESDQVGFALAETLLKLGHESDALAVIEKTRETWPAHPGLAYLHAKILLDRKEVDRGLSILEIAMQADEAEPSWFILYARTLIGEYERYTTLETSEPDVNTLIKAHKMIQKAVSIAPESFEARLLLAEVLSLRGEDEAAYAAYKQIVELPEASQPEWNWRVQAGLGRTALALKQTETALASLQNALASNPESISLQRCLATAYRQANLSESAQTSARAALALAPDEIGNLLWFAEFMGSIGADGEAVDAYRLARQIAPERVDLSILLVDALLKQGELEEARQTLGQAQALEKVDAEELRKIAHAYMRMGDHPQALASMERAVGLPHEGNESFQSELAELYAKAGELDKALETIQKAIRENPGRVEHYLFLSDLQDRSNRPQAAIASLEHVLRLIGAKASGEGWVPTDRPAAGDQVNSPPCDLANVHTRFARLLQKVENYASALYHAEQALEECPQNVAVRCLAVELAMKQLQYDRAEKLASTPALDESSEPMAAAEDKDSIFWLATLYSLRAELALERGEFPAAAKWLEDGLKFAEDHPRLRAVEIRMLAHEGEYQPANESYEELRQVLATAGERAAKDIHGSLAAAAIDLRRWLDGLDLHEKYVNANPSEPQGLLRYAAALAQAAEWQLTVSDLKVNTHAAPENALAESTFGKFSQMLADAKKFSNSAEIDRWRARGEVIFHPTSGSIRALAGQKNPEDAGILVQALARLGNVDSARQMGEQFRQDAQVNLQMSLLDIPNSSASALESVQTALAIDPKNPILHAAAARAFETNGDFVSALVSLKAALFYWPDEGEWQKWAGEVAEGCRQFHDACEHYEKALQLNAGSLEIANKLGKVYLRAGRVDEAVEVFSKATSEEPQNAELWLNLAEAQFAAGKQSEALGAAETSVRLEPNSSVAKVLCGEISLALGSESKALSMLRDALKLDPTNVRARLLASKILSRKGKEQEALAEITKAVEEMPAAIELQTEKIRLVFKLQGAAQALKALQPLLEEHPDEEPLLALQARACAEAGDIQQAEAAALKALRLNASQFDMQRLLGNIYQQTGQLDKSLHHMSEAARLDPENIEAYLELGEIYAARREYAQALKTYQQATKIAPEDHRPFYQCALVLRDGKDYPGAENMMRRAAQLAPHDVNIRRQLGAIVALNLVQSCQEANT